MGKGEIAHDDQFLLFPQCFQKSCTADTQKPGLVWERVNSLSNDKLLDLSNLKAFAVKKKNNNNNKTEKLKLVCERVEDMVGKEEKHWLPAFSPFLTKFSKRLFFKFVKSRYCLGKG